MVELIRRLLRGELPWALVDQAVVSGANFLVGILLVRALGLAEFGRYTLAWLAVQLAQALATSLVIRPMMSLGPRQTAAEAESYGGGVTALAIAVAAGLAVVLACATLLVGSFGLADGARQLAGPLAIAAVTAQVQDFLRRRCFTFGQPARALLLDMIRAGSQVIGIAWLMLSVDGADAALALWIMAAAHGLAAAVGVLGPGRPEVSARALPSVAARHWQVGRWLLATTGVEWLQGQLLTLIAGAVLGATVVGAMRATQQVIGITHLLFEGLQNVVPVGAARALAASGRRALRAYTFGAMFGTGLATGAIVFMLLAAPEAWLSLIYGERLAGWGWLLYWQGAIYLAIVPGLPLSAGLTALERTRPLFLAQMLGAVATVLLGVPVARSFGIQGLMLLTLVVLVGRQLLLGRAFWRASAQAG